jgi:hypothetical protein
VFLQKRVAFRSAETCVQRSPAYRRAEGVSPPRRQWVLKFTSKFSVSVGSRRAARLRTDDSLPSSTKRPGPPISPPFRHPTPLPPSSFTAVALSTTGIPPPSAGKSVAPKCSQPISELRTIVNFGNFPTAHGCGFSETVLLQKFPKLTERYEPGFQRRVPAEVTAVIHRSSSDPGVLVVRLHPSHGTRSVFIPSVLTRSH